MVKTRGYTNDKIKRYTVVIDFVHDGDFDGKTIVEDLEAFSASIHKYEDFTSASLTVNARDILKAADFAACMLDGALLFMGVKDYDIIRMFINGSDVAQMFIDGRRKPKNEEWNSKDSGPSYSV